MKTLSGETKVKTAYGQDVDLTATFEHKVIETVEELHTEFTDKELIDLANTTLKNNARSAAIAKVTSPYKPDPNSPAEIRKRMIADAMKGNKSLTEEKAGQIVDALLSAQ